jgi:hypothetical protein
MSLNDYEEIKSDEKKNENISNECCCCCRPIKIFNSNATRKAVVDEY